MAANEATAARLPLADAYLPWARATNFRDAVLPGARGEWHWLLLELSETTSASEFASAARQSARDDLRVPAHYLNPPQGLERSRYCTAACSPRFLAALVGEGGAVPGAELLSKIRRFEIGFVASALPDPDSTLPVAQSQGGAEAGVVVGIVDDGLAIANERFRSFANGRHATRLLAFWDQHQRAEPASPWVHGRVFGQADLNARFAALPAAAGPADEALLHAGMGYTEVRHRVTHGTHVMDLACGADPRDPAAPPIVAVQLPGGSIADTSCASSTAFMLDAIRFVLATADAAVPHGQSVPVIINLSIGNIAGPHDGSSIFEQALDELIGLRSDCDVVLAAGNSYLLRCHAWIDLPPGSAMTLNWQIQPGDGTPSFLELWFTDPSGASGVGDIGGVRLTVTPPGGQPIEVPLGRSVAVPGEKGQAVAMLSLHQQVANGRKGMGLLAVAPTQCTGEWRAAAPSGAWRVTLHNAGASALECNAFVQRDDAPLGRPTLGRQSYLYDEDYRRFDARGAVEVLDSDAAYVRRVGTLNGLASGDRVHVAGGALTDRAGGATAARYSSVPLQASEPSRWRVLAVTEDSPVLKGVLAAGTASGSCATLSGTSMAAPQLTRYIADRLRTVALPTRTIEDFQGHPVPAVPMAPPQQARWRRRRGEPA